MSKIYKQTIGFIVLIFMVMQFTACHKNHSGYHTIHPSHVEPIEGSEFSKVELTDDAIRRIGVLTEAIGEETVAKGPSASQTKKVIPYSAVIYSPHGDAWVYTNPESHVYIRDNVEVEYVYEGKAVLVQGPPVGTKIVTQGVAELYGTEYEVGH